MEKYPSIPERNIVLILSGPAGSGKTTLFDRLLQEHSDGIQRVVTATTRPPRPGEVDGVDYHFLSDGSFENRIASNSFYEWAEIHRYRYGTLKSAVVKPLSLGKDIVLNIDVQGADQYREIARQDECLRGRVVTVFIMPKGPEQLLQRLQARGDTEKEIATRLQTAHREVDCWKRYDYVITTGSKEVDYQKLLSVYMAEKLRVPNA